MYRLYLTFKPVSCNPNFKASSIIKMQIVHSAVMVLLLTLLVVISVILITFPEESYLMIRGLFYKNIRPGKQSKFWMRQIGIIIMLISCTLIFYFVSINPMLMYI